jgi:hypothetical protein
MIDQKVKLAEKPGSKSGARPAGAERRSAQRFALVATAEIVDTASGTRLNGRVSDLSLSGCYMDVMTPLAEKSSVQLRIKYNAQTVELKATVRFSHAGLGMGIGFESLSPEQMETLGAWIAMLTSGRRAPIELSTSEQTPAASTRNTATNPRIIEDLTTLLIRKGILTPAEVSELFSKST